MLDFAKSIMTGNASGIKEFNTEADLRRWCIEHQYAYTPTHGGYYRLEDDKPGRNRPDLAAHVKAGNSKVGNFEDPKKAKHYIEMWERRRDDAKRSLQNAEGHLKEAMKHRYGDKEFNQREVQRYQEAVKAAEASIKQYDDLIKSAAKTSFGNTRTGNSSKSEIIEKKKKEGATLKVDNGQKLEFSDGSTFVKTSFSDDYREAHNYVGNSRVGNRDIYLKASNSGELNLSDDGTGSMYDPVELGRYDFSGKSEALSVARELEQLKRKAEQKVKDADKFINAIKQWASGLK